jgi:hypothetical protein
MTNTLSGVRERAQPHFSFHQHLPAVAATVLVLTSAGLGAYAGWEFGKAGGLVLAVGLAVAAVAGEALKPFAVAATVEAASRLQIFRMFGCMAVALVCVAYSVVGHVFLATMARSDLSAQRVADGRAGTDARQDRDRALAELKAVGTPRTAGELRPLIASATKLAGNCARIETATQREACKALPALQAESASHDRKLKAEAALAVADHRIASAGKTTERVADPLASAVSAYTVMIGKPMTPEEVGPLLALVPMLLLEIASMFAVVLTRRDPEAGSPPHHGGSPSLTVTPAPVIALPAPIAAAGSHPAAVRDAVGKIAAIAAERGGTLRVQSKREIARMIDASPPTASRALAAMAGIAAVTIDQTGVAVRLIG